MNLLSIENIGKSYSEKPLLDHISFGIEEGDRIGLIGINGTGKSTLLKIIAGIETPDKGRIIRGNGMVIEYLSQNPSYDLESTVLEQVFQGENPMMKVLRAYEEAIYHPDFPSDKMLQLTQEMDRLDGWAMESEAKTILTILGIADFDKKIGSLSGGQKKRVALAAALIRPSHLLILDEPTNHLDNDTIDWLEQYLTKRKGALLMITHDRYFLDRIVNQIIELDNGALYTYKGNYNYFLEKKMEREEIEIANEKKRQNLFRKELAWIRQGAQARSTKQKARIERFEKLKEEVSKTMGEKLEISVASSRLGRKVIELDHVCKSFDDKLIIEDFEYIVLRSDRIGIVGPNGAGKSTLMQMIGKKLEPDSGCVEVGETVRIGFFSQDTEHMQEQQRVIEYIREGAEYLKTTEGDKITASQMLERFLFPLHLQGTPLGKLSGGEKRRLHLLRVLMEAPNVLLLDEPTNDLDIETLNILEEYLENFDGAVIAVSHDRYFLDKIAEKIFLLPGDGKVIQFTGNYSYYKEHSETSSNKANIKSSEQDKEAKNSTDKERSVEKKSVLKFSFKEQREYETIDTIIAEIEQQIEEKDLQIEEAVSDYSLLQQLTKEKEGLEGILEEKMKRWVYLNELAEKIEEERMKRNIK
ncbi:MAG: ABC-F family ATP-binding cassette domain-containing protein [Thermotaleaceae bacterium]